MSLARILKLPAVHSGQPTLSVSTVPKTQAADEGLFGFNCMTSAQYDVAIMEFVKLVAVWVESEIRCARLREEAGWE